jgi:hypothetical protein
MIQLRIHTDLDTTLEGERMGRRRCEHQTRLIRRDQFSRIKESTYECEVRHRLCMDDRRWCVVRSTMRTAVRRASVTARRHHRQTTDAGASSR